MLTRRQKRGFLNHLTRLRVRDLNRTDLNDLKKGDEPGGAGARGRRHRDSNRRIVGSIAEGPVREFYRRAVSCDRGVSYSVTTGASDSAILGYHWQYK